MTNKFQKKQAKTPLITGTNNSSGNQSLTLTTETSVLSHNHDSGKNKVLILRKIKALKASIAESEELLRQVQEEWAPFFPEHSHIHGKTTRHQLLQDCSRELNLDKEREELKHLENSCILLFGNTELHDDTLPQGVVDLNRFRRDRDR